MSAPSTASRRAARILAASCCAMAATLISSLGPAAAFYSEVKPSLKIGVDCIGQVSVLAPKLTMCTIAGTKARIWCPNGQMFEGEIDSGGPAASIARSLCGIAQVP